MDSHDPGDVALGRMALESGIIDRSDASRILAIATSGKCGFVEAARRLGLTPSVIERLSRVRPGSTSAGRTSSGTHQAASGDASSGTKKATASRGALAKRLEPGAAFAGHVIERTLGQGGMGVVLLARNAAGASHAIKVPFFDGKAEDRRKRFIREAQALAKLDHPGIVKVHAVGEEDGAPFCVLELVVGEALDACIEKGAFEVPRALEIAEEVAHALAHAHGAGIVHRDVKPGNIMLRRDTGRAILMDFGLARDDDEAERLTQTGALLGTPRYMPPEQAAGSRQVDGRADIYALGATLYELLVGGPVFEADSTIALVGKIMTEPARAPSRSRPGIAAAVDAIVLRTLEKAPADRYATALELAQDLARARQGKSVDTRPRLVVRRRRLILAAVLVALVVGVGVGAAARDRAQRERAIAHAEERLRARNAVIAGAEPWRRARFGLTPSAPEAFGSACARFDEVSERDASDALTAEVAGVRAIVAVERALLANDRPAARASLEKVVDGAEKKLLLVLAQDDPAAARKALEPLARELADMRLRTEAALALVRLETESDPHAALRRLDVLPPPATEDAREGEKALRKRALAASAEKSAEDGSDQAGETLTLLERLDPEAAKEAARRCVRAALSRAGKDAARSVATRLVKLHDRDSSSFAQPGLAPALLGLAAELFVANELVLTSRCFELATRSDPAAYLPRSIMDGLPIASQALLTKAVRKPEDVVDLELALARIGEHSSLLDSFEDPAVILAGLEKRLERTPRDWAVKLTIAARTENHARALALIQAVEAAPETTPRARTVCHIVKSLHCRALRRNAEAIEEAEAGIQGGYCKPDVIESAIAELLLDLGRYDEAMAWGERGARDADDRVERSNQGFDALAAGRAPGNPLQPIGAIGTALRVRPRATRVQALLALGKMDEARALFTEARVAGGDREVPFLREQLESCAKTLEAKGIHDGAAVARELAALVKKG